MESFSSQVNLGDNILSARKKRGFTIKELAERVNISASMLSQIERGLANPSIATMKAIADALNEPLYNFFLPQVENSETLMSRAVTRTKYTFYPEKQTSNIPQIRPDGYECERLSAWRNTNFEMLRVKLSPGYSSNPIPRLHNDDEIAYVESGTVLVQLGSETEELHPHDTVCIPARTPHRWINASDEAVYLILSMADFTK